MRPTGVVLIALYHFAGAALLLLIAILSVVGGGALGAMFGGLNGTPVGGMGLGFAVGLLGGIFFFTCAILAAVTGYGVWSMREWGRILCIVFAVVAIVFSLPGLLMGFHLLFLGGFGFFRLFVSGLIIWYLVKPEIRALFQRRNLSPAEAALEQQK